MKDKLFRIKIFLQFLILEPWTEKISLPNFRTINWVMILLSFIVLKSYILTIIFLILGVALYIWKDWKSGDYMHWYRKRNYPAWKEVKKK